MQIETSDPHFVYFVSQHSDADFAEWNRLLAPIAISHQLSDSLTPVFVCRREDVEQSAELMWLILGKDIQ